MAVILIGSRALALRAGKFFKRTPVDFDFVCRQSELFGWLDKNLSKVGMKKTYWERERTKFILEGETNCEFEIESAHAPASTWLMRYLVMEDADSIETAMGIVPNMDMLFTLKASHRYLKNSPHFWKTVADYHLMKRLGAKVRPEYAHFLRLREGETYNYKHPKLNQGKMGFFSGDQVNYTYDHDSVHQAVATFDRPAYTMFQKDGAEVQVDKAKFFALEFEQQIASVVEESCVLAIERSLVPHPGAITPEQAWRFALSKVCTSITSGWWREFAYENIFDVLKAYPADYWQRFQAGVANGAVTKLERIAAIPLREFAEQLKEAEKLAEME